MLISIIFTLFFAKHLERHMELVGTETNRTEQQLYPEHPNIWSSPTEHSQLL